MDQLTPLKPIKQEILYWKEDDRVRTTSSVAVGKKLTVVKTDFEGFGKFKGSI